MFDVSLDKTVMLNADAQTLLAQVHQGEINSIDVLTYSLSLNAQKIPRDQVRYLLITIKQTLD